MAAQATFWDLGACNVGGSSLATEQGYGARRQREPALFSALCSLGHSRC